MDSLEKRVSDLLKCTAEIHAHIESHEFSLAEVKAADLSVYCGTVNILANRLADKED